MSNSLSFIFNSREWRRETEMYTTTVYIGANACNRRTVISYVTKAVVIESEQQIVREKLRTNEE